MMVPASLLPIASAMFVFYAHGGCREILRRQFGRDFYQAVADANRLEFLSLRKTLEGIAEQADYSRIRSMLKQDF